MVRKQISKWGRAAVCGLAAMACLSGCTRGKSLTVAVNPSKTDAPVQSMTQVKQPEGIGYEDFKARNALREENALSDAFVGSVKRFSYDSAGRILAQSDENRNYSPVSLYFALALAAEGAEGKTGEEFFALLGVDDREELADQCRKLYRLLYVDNECGRQALANSLWIAQGLPLKEAYLTTAQEDFYASLFSVDFGSPETGKAIGKWISDQTNGTLEPQITTSPQEVMSIINTVYFNDQWINEFVQSANRKGSFTAADGTEVECEYMYSEYSAYSYFEGDGYAGTSLGFKNGGSIRFILPDEGAGVKTLVEQEGKLQEMFEPQKEVHAMVKLSLPKFTFGDSLELTELLQDMGLREAFTGQADFSAMTDGQAVISWVKQETHIGLDENGVEASAYTEIALAGGAMEESFYELNLNRPFLYGIMSKEGVPLFIGVCNNPAQ